MICGQNFIGQNVVDKMSWSKCCGQYGQNVLLEMFWSKCPGDIVVGEISGFVLQHNDKIDISIKLQ